MQEVLKTLKMYRKGLIFFNTLLRYVKSGTRNTSQQPLDGYNIYQQRFLGTLESKVDVKVGVQATEATLSQLLVY